VEADGWTLLWQNRKYRLWDAGAANWAIVTDVAAPNGIERVNGKPFFWLGGPPADLRVTARDAGCVYATATVTPGPRVSQATVRHVTVASSAGSTEHLTFAAGGNRFGWLVGSGVNHVTLTADDPPDVPSPASDPRPLVTGLSDLTIRSTTGYGTARLQQINNPNGLEELQGRPFFWIGGRPTTIHIGSDRAANVSLRADLVLGPSIAPAVTTRRLRIRGSGDDEPRETNVGAGPWSAQIAVNAGDTVIELEAGDPVAVPVQPNGDRRPLVIGVRDLQVSASPATADCR
jgi:hypothetical protein